MFKTSIVLAATALVGNADFTSAVAGCFPTYIQGASYSAGDRVSAAIVTTNSTNETYNFECKDGPVEVWCSSNAFAPHGIYSSNGWTKEDSICSVSCLPSVSVAVFSVALPLGLSFECTVPRNVK